MSGRWRIPLLLVLALVLVLALSSAALAGGKAPSPGEVVKLTFIHHAPAPVWSAAARANPAARNSGDSFYKLLGYKWATLPVSFSIDSSVPRTFDTAIDTSFDTWDAATGAELFANSYGTTTGSTTESLDGKNIISFRQFPANSNILAMTSIWIYKASRTMAETDIVFNENYSWDISPKSGYVFDVQNIATHEIGHVVGLADLYQSRYSPLTMYGYSGALETDKRSLEAGDIAGTQALYGR